MRNKAPLALLEQILMLLIFALAAVICLRAFLWSDDTSRHSARRDDALIHAQTMAETVKAYGGEGNKPQRVSPEETEEVKKELELLALEENRF